MKPEEFEKKLLAETERWKQTPFLFRGYTPRGADCVGAIVGILRSCGIALPDDDGGVYEKDWFLHDRKRNRYLEGWLKFGREVQPPYQVGDVICFWAMLYGKVTHSGLMLNGQNFFHSHRPKGVAINSLQEPIWARHRKSAIRLMLVEEALKS